jgi:AraC-like DNA-binding protein
LLEELLLRLTQPAPPVGRLTGYHRTLFQLILWLLREDRHTGENLQSRNILLESLRPALKVLRESSGREPGTLELARLCGLSTSTFVRRMRAGYGVSPKQFIIRHRMERAKRLLRSSSRAVQAIATELGYREPGHFTWQFKKWVGVSPTEFRERRR